VKGNETVNKYHYPTPEELYAIEQAARRARSEGMRRLLVSGASAVKALFSRALAALNAKVSHRVHSKEIHHA
jgi:hypothetical protein